MWCWWLMTCESKTKPSCDWSDPESRSELIDGSVTDGLALIEGVENVELCPEQADAVGLLGVVTGQDVEPDPQREGRWRIARRVAKDRTISTVDPEARHGHKTRTHKRDEYKAHIADEPETGLVTALALTPANTPDAEPAAASSPTNPPPPRSSPIRPTRQAPRSKRSTISTTPPPSNPSYANPTSKTATTATISGSTPKPVQMTCPAGRTTRTHPGGTAPFSRWCNGCPLRARCTTCKKGRTIKVDQYHDLRAANKARWAQGDTQNTYRLYRPPVERAIAWLTRPKARRVPYRGLVPNQQWLNTRTAASNLRRLINLGLHHTPTGWTLNPT